MTPQQTAAAIARIRADESRLPERDRLFDDPYAARFDDPAGDVSEAFGALPFFREQIRLRTRYFDDAVRAALAGGVRTLVLVGAGFDTRSLRMPEVRQTGTRVIEIDHADQIEKKRGAYRELAGDVPPHVRLLSADLMREDLVQTLPGAVLAATDGAPTPALLVCEGLVGYLDRDAVARLFVALARSAVPGSRLTLNHTTRWWPRAELDARLDAAGFRPLPSPSFAELHARHLGGPLPEGSDEFGLVDAELRG
ncbi:MAG: class I SAM-dependent methyltransferase [Deltaproteobacteria bacterium]|nr:class I SAM-dependent methyltransferase [Deltaproteobacteria bacterium]